jgi:hypothetical protein
VSDSKPDAWDPQDAERKDIRDCWETLRGPPSPIEIITTRANDLKSQVSMAAAQASFKLARYTNEKYNQQTVTGEVLADIATKGVELFMEQWLEILRSRDLAGLIEVVLEGQQLSPDEMKGFLRALPQSLLNRVVDSAFGTVTGVHALIAFEIHRRRLGISDYTLSKEGERTGVRFFDPQSRKEIEFFLDEAFQGKTPPE